MSLDIGDDGTNQEFALLALESELLAEATRKDAARVRTLLAPDFREFGRSGQVYSREEILALLQGEASAPITLFDFAVRSLAEDVALVTYRTRREIPGERPVLALRSSIWVRTGKAWQMVFHQGTPMPDSQNSEPSC